VRIHRRQKGPTLNGKSADDIVARYAVPVSPAF
jgi:hypothetical protein